MSSNFLRAGRRVLALALVLLMFGAGLSGCATHQPAAPSDLPPALARQLAPVSAEVRPSPLSPDWQHGVFMEIFVRAYQDSNGDGIGDLRGLISRLDYLQDLGVTGLWLMPVFPSQDQDHGYAVTDYRAIEPDYGTLADFDELLKQAHARGIGVILDYVINHSAAQHPLFALTENTRQSRWRDWYVWRDSKPAGWQIYGQNPWYETDAGAYFAGFWNQMPDFNLKNPAVLAWHHDNLRFWLNRGVDGFRFDAVGNLVENGPDAWEAQPENDAVMAGVRQVVMSYPNRYMVCESPGAPTHYAAPEICGASFAFTQNFNVVGAAAGDDGSLADLVAYARKMPAGMATFASNHDSFAGERLWDQLDGDAAQVRLAAAGTLLLPGTPFVYYGEEIGMSGAASLKGDLKLRTPMSWRGDADSAGFIAGFTTAEPFRVPSANVQRNNVAAQIDDPASLRSFYRAVIHLRTASPALMRGRFEAAEVHGLTLSFQRVLGTERELVVFNYGRKPVRAEAAGLPAGATLVSRWPQGGADQQADAAGRLLIELPRESFAVYRVGAAR
jgi:glycosidase